MDRTFELAHWDMSAEAGIFVPNGVVYEERWRLTELRGRRRSFMSTCQAFPHGVAPGRPDFVCAPSDAVAGSASGPALVLSRSCWNGTASFGGESLALVRSPEGGIARSRFWVTYSAYRGGVLVGAIHPSSRTSMHGVWFDRSLPYEAQAALIYASAVLYWFDAGAMDSIARAICFPPF